MAQDGVRKGKAPDAVLDPLSDEPGRIRSLRRYDLMQNSAQENLDRAVRLVSRTLEVPISAISLIDSDQQWFKSSCGLGVSHTSRDSAFCDHTIRNRVPMIVPDALADPRFRHNPLVTGSPYIRAYMGVPLTMPDGYNIGALCAIDTRPRADFTEVRAEIVADLAHIVVDAIELRMISQTDMLTGAVSRRYFLAETEREIARANRYGRQLSLIMLDIDHFKSVNDRHGHPVGDQVLVELVDRLQSQLRGHDVIGRLGGEEFAILLPETSMEQASRVARRLRRHICDMPFTTRAGPVPVTVSQGVVAYLSGIPAVEVILERADFELYRAKQAGRDRVCIAFEELAGGWSSLSAIH